MSNIKECLKQILYQDDAVKITPNQITVLKYYFPIPASKNIDMKDVIAIHLRDNVDGKMWGTTPGHFDKWFALDGNRNNKQQYIQIVVKDSDIKVAFSPSNCRKVINLIEQYASKNLVKQQAKFGYNSPQKLSPHKPFHEGKTGFTGFKLIQNTNLNSDKVKYTPPTDKIVPSSDQTEQSQVVLETQSKSKGFLQTIGQKINEKIEDILNVPMSKQKLKKEHNQSVSSDTASDDKQNVYKVSQIQKTTKNQEKKQQSILGQQNQSIQRQSLIK